ncbi:MAG TPA: type II toxin-antitoxin system VapC family toxin [Bryobacteraceae bacterium]|nr:type II toxin-antitoxin system VapC family toxin [Bryobacteraceae bacterium]
MAGSQAQDSQLLSVITVGELRRGIRLLDPSARRTQLAYFVEVTVPLWFAERVLPVTQTIAERWGALDGERQLAGRPLNMADGLIAATALEHQLTVVTRSEKDFAGLGVTLLNPWEGKGQS